MLKPIQVSPEAILFLHNDMKEICIMDPKASSVLKAFSNQKHVIMPNFVYSNKFQQIIAREESKTMIDIWNVDQQKPKFKISLEAMSSLAIPQCQNIILGGSKGGALYVWQAQTGVLFRQFPAHHSQIIHVSMDKNMYITFATQNEIKLWRLVDIFGNQPEVKCYKSLSTKEKIISIINTVQRYYVLTASAVLIFAKLSGERQQIILIQSATCFAINGDHTHIYVGSSNKKIYEHRINFVKEYRQIKVDQQGQIKSKKTPQSRVFQGHQHEVTAITYVNSLGLLISGSKKGEIITWKNGQKISKKTFNYQISCLMTIDRPSIGKPKTQKQPKKISTLHKHQVSVSNPNKQTYEYIGPSLNIEQDNFKDFQNIVKTIKDAGYQAQIERLKQRCQKLLQSQKHYTRLFIET